ncbi:PREDICTED: pseudopodium-enriched atypical kinase 1-like [Cyprinodon variegatus]|uniref:Pseudopodium-enriched atypical kinase 1-like n=1 Tax=Cyprinodon variegatus TaxID=28743 RepID=A0A3Q2D860_CYPVA|nr:PREDICTED: pseudopodium-enriched atypical kinase 1-like [Cyprinodon variegatus]
MASASRERDQPPILPVKQHRRSSMESDSVFSPTGFQHPSLGYSDVFSQPTDCHAAQCPIHQRYDPFKHQMRFFSDGTPPPVPKKRLTRTLSLPGIDPPAPCSLSPLSPLPRHPQNFDNPLYMMAPIPGTFISEESEDFKPARSPNSLPSFSQLSFATPDEDLFSIFGNFQDQDVVSERIQHHQLLFLRSMAQGVIDRSLLVKEKEPDTYKPQDFLLSQGAKPKTVGDKTYYSLQSPKFPGRVLGLRVCKGTKSAPSARRKERLHANVQDVLAYFQPSINEESPTNDLPTCAESDCRASNPPDRGSNETVESLLQRGHCVSIERDLPHTSLEDFVLDSCSCKDYERQVCVLLLQVLMGSHHLYNSGTAAELRPREILLVWPNRERSQGLETQEGDGPRVQELWRKYGSPCVLVVPQSAASSAPQPLTAIKYQIGALIQFCLRQREGPIEAYQSLYRKGLQHFTSLLQSDSSPQVTDIIAMLQVLLWGPQVSVFEQKGFSTMLAVQRWLTVKRALLVMKLAEVGLIQDQSGLNWEVLMCLKYLSFTDSETVVGVGTQLCSILR